MQWLALSLIALAGCGNCGTYEISTGFLFGEDPVDGHYIERCGAVYGSTGALGVSGDETVWLSLDPDAHGDRSWDALPIELELEFPFAELVPGSEIATLSGGAYLLDAGGNTYAPAWLTEGSVEVLDGGYEGDLCEVNDGDGPIYRLAWDLVWEDEASGYRYTAQGEDKVQISTWLKTACSGF